ncbi:MAG: hypothetical protein ABIJ91_00220 [Candidatus Kuenenbacteria bacterium]
MKYLFSFLAIIAGFCLVKYANNIANSFGRSAWAEHYFGSYGGTRLLIKTIGILFIIGALLVISGLMNTLLYSIFSSTIGGLSY